jgi:triosephosphate isomerase (TIM)
MRTPVIAGNWKLNKKIDEARDFVDRLLPLIKTTVDREIVLAPPFTIIGHIGPALAGSRIFLAGQDCFWEEEGAYTGEVSPGMLADVGCSHVIIGHSERRQFFGETDEAVKKKVKAVIKAGMIPIICIGETLAERESERTFRILDRQVKSALQGLSSDDMNSVILAYEPVWAIGTGKTASETQAQEVHGFIRHLTAELYNTALAEHIRILYGGSVKAENIAGLMCQPDIDGALVGGASLSAGNFASIINYGK